MDALQLDAAKRQVAECFPEQREGGLPEVILDIVPSLGDRKDDFDRRHPRALMLNETLEAGRSVFRRPGTKASDDGQSVEITVCERLDEHVRCASVNTGSDEFPEKSRLRCHLVERTAQGRLLRLLTLAFSLEAAGFRGSTSHP